ncbi:dynamin family GTPase [Kocuria palustris]|nr:dynamin family GTPase [Kocuria palustris]
MSFEDLIPVVNKLQDIVTTTQVADIDLPLLAVVGSQSCGKLSVLENIVGRDFLPRGTGIVTRRPLVLQLINIKEDDPIVHQAPQQDITTSNGEINLEDHLRKSKGGASRTATEWGEFLHVPGKRFYLFNDIRGEIERETARIAGQNKGISRLPINLKIYSTRVLNLTLIDLPGLTKIPVGDQPSDIERQTRNLIMEYISKPNCIILAVSPANVDLVNSESLKLARQVDPTGKRTVGILTKLDLMDQGTNAVDILKGNVYPLKLGFIGIVNRSQQDIADNKLLDDSLFTEQQFFVNHPAYRLMLNKCGTKYLASTLNKILMNHIRERLPDIKAKLNTLMGQAEQELALYGDIPLALTSSGEARGAMVLTLMTKFANSFVHLIDGTQVLDFSTKELCGGARIYHIYNEVYGNQLAMINPTHNLTIQDIRTAIRNSTGPRASLFVPELAFDLLVKPQIKLLEEPSKRCVELVYEELMKIVHNVCSLSIGLELNRYPKLQAKLIEVVLDLLRERLGPTTKYVELLIEIHRAYINTNHPNFIGAAQAMNSVVEERQKQKELESNNKLRLASERILKSNLTKNQDEESEEDKDELEDINSVDDVIKSPKHLQSHQRTSLSLTVQRLVTGVHDNQESYLNYFFGKDPLVHQQQLQQQAQLNPTPFKFPHPHEQTLQFIGSNNNLDALMSKLLMNEDDSTSFETDDTINELSEREQLECELIRRLIISYFSIVREMIQDQVPKLIMCLLVNYIKQHIQNRLVVKLYNESMFDELLQEDESIQAEREKCIEILKTYREASNIISDVV